MNFYHEFEIEVDFDDNIIEFQMLNNMDDYLK